MFWRFGYQNASALDTILDSESATLEQVLNEEDLLQEVKTRNQKLITFLTKPLILKNLIRYVIDQDLDDSLKLRYPYLATEILCCEIDELISAILEDTSLLNSLWDILDRPTPLNVIHANSFAKIMGVFITRNTLQMLEYIKGREKVVDKLLNHVESAGIVDLLLRLMTSDDFHDGRDVEEWLHGENIIEKMVDRMNPSLEEQSHTTTSFALMDMVAAYHHAQDPDPNVLNSNALIKELKSAKIITKLTSYMLDSKAIHSSSCIINGINILIELLRRGTCADEYDIVPVMPEGGEFGNLPPPPPPVHRDSLDIEELITVLVARISAFKEILINPRKPIVPMETSNGRINPVGSERLTITELFAELLRTQKGEVYKIFYQEGVMKTCLDLFFTHKWNNLLHMVICDMINTIFDASYWDAKDLIISIFTDAAITKRIVQAVKLNSHLVEQPKGVRLGYMGHITLLTDKTLVLLERKLDTDFEHAIMPLIQSEDWQEYVAKQYRDTKDREIKPLGGQKPQFISHENEEDVPFAMHVDSNTDQLARYMIQQVVSEIPERFLIAGDDTTGEDENVWTDFAQDSTFDVQANLTATDIDQNDDDDDSDDDVEKWGDKLGSSPMFNDSKATPVVASNSESAEAQFAFPSSASDPFSDSGLSSGTPSTMDGDNWADFSKLSVSDPIVAPVTADVVESKLEEKTEEPQ